MAIQFACVRLCCRHFSAENPVVLSRCSLNVFRFEFFGLLMIDLSTAPILNTPNYGQLYTKFVQFGLLHSAVESVGKRGESMPSIIRKVTDPVRPSMSVNRSGVHFQGPRKSPSNHRHPELTLNRHRQHVYSRSFNLICFLFDHSRLKQIS